MRKINLFLLVSVICVSQFWINSVSAFSFGKKKTTTTTTTAPAVSTTATTAPKPSMWQRAKSHLPGGKPVQPTTTTTATGQPVVQTTMGVVPTSTAPKPSMWQRAKATVTRKPIQPTQPTMGVQRLPAATPLPAPMASPSSTVVALSPPPPPAAAPVPVPTAVATDAAPAPAATTTKWWQRKPKTPRPETGVQIGQQRPAAPTEERALVVREQETDVAVVAPAAQPPTQAVPRPSMAERVAAGAQAAQQATTTALSIGTQVAGTAAQVAAMFKKPTQQPGMQPGAYPQDQYPAEYPPGTYPEQYPPALPGAVQRMQQVAGAAQLATQVTAETARAIAGPPAVPLQPMPEEMQPSVEPAQIKVEKDVFIKEEVVTEEVLVKTPEELIAEFKELTNKIIEFKSVPAQNNIMAIAALANKSGEALRQLNKQLDDPKLKGALTNIVEIFSGIEKMGKWAKDFGLTEDTYIGLAQTKAEKALADYVNAFEEPTEQPSGRKTIQDVQPKGDFSQKELIESAIKPEKTKEDKKVKEVKEKKVKVDVPAAMEQEEVSATAAAA